MITTTIESLIQNHIDKSFTTHDSKFPLGICGTCRTTLNEYERDIRTRTLPKMPNYVDLHISRSTRNNNDSCDCYICETAQSTSHQKSQKGRGNTRDLNAVDVRIKKNVDANSSEMSSTESSHEPKSMKICRTCFQVVSRGIQHTCTNANVNVLKMVDNLPEKSQ